MYTPIVTELTGISVYDLAERFHDRPYFIFLDSRCDENELGKWSFLSFDPFRVVKSKGEAIQVLGGGEAEIMRGNALDKIKELLGQYRVDPSCCAEFGPMVGGGALGYLSYDFGRQLERLPSQAVDDLDIPECYFCFYDHLVIYDHDKGKLYLSYLDISENKAGYVQRLSEEIGRICKEARPRSASAAAKPVRPLRDRAIAPQLDKESYLSRFRRIKEYILSGDVYQVNFTQRFQVSLDRDERWTLYRNLMQINPAPFACYLDFSEVCVASSSPERFLRVTGPHVETRPIKGTIRRGRTPQEDLVQKSKLLSSIKDKAELAMIVDLMRNDIGRVCEIGSVVVDRYPEIESYASVHHLVATISGELSSGKDAVELLKCTFPGGSITGAPKIRAMEIIDELEPVERGIYTGSIGYIGFNGNMDTNIVIRTFVIKDGKGYIQAGGGIVVESDEEGEYQESLLKAEKLFQAV